MPSSATITAFYNFSPGSRAKATEVNTNFGNFRGHLIPIDPNTNTAINNTYALGSSEYRWTTNYIGTLDLRTSTSTAALTMLGQTSNTTGAFEFKIGSTTVGVMGINGLTRRSLESSGFTVTAADSGTFTWSTSGWGDVTNLSLTITVYKSTVHLMLTAFGAATSGVFIANSSSIGTMELGLRLIRDTSTTQVLGVNQISAPPNSLKSSWPGSAFQWFDNPGPGTYVYKVQVNTFTNATTATVSFVKLAAIEY